MKVKREGWRKKTGENYEEEEENEERRLRLSEWLSDVKRQGNKQRTHVSMTQVCLL